MSEGVVPRMASNEGLKSFIEQSLCVSKANVLIYCTEKKAVLL